MFTKSFVYTYYNVLCNFILCTLQCMFKYVNNNNNNIITGIIIIIIYSFDYFCIKIIKK
jgi:hypothetical protein